MNAMLDQLLNPAFWKGQLAVVSAPWVSIPLILILGIFGWLLRDKLNRGQIVKAFKAQLQARDERLQLARQIEYDIAEKLALAHAAGEQLSKQVALYKSVEAGFATIRSSVSSTVAAIDKANSYSEVLRATLSPPSR